MRKDVLIYFAGKVILAVVNLAIIILAVRLLGSAEYGKYTLVFNATMLICTLTFGWIQQSILRFLTAYPREETLVVSRFFMLTLVSSFSAAIIGMGLCIFYFSLGWPDILVVTAFIFLNNLFMFRLVLSQARRKPFNYALLESTFNLLFLAGFLVLVFVFHQRLFIVLFIAMVAGLLLAGILRMILIPEKHDGPDSSKLYLPRGFNRQVFSFGFPITAWLFLSYLMNISDRFIIKEFSGYEDVGVYAVIKDFIIKIATFSTIPLLLAYQPAIVENWNNGRKDEAIRLIRQGLGYCLLVASAVAMVFLLFNRHFFSLVLNLKMGQPMMVSVILTLSAFLWQAALLLHKPLELLLKTRLMLVAILVALALNLAGNFLFVPRFGYMASVWISLTSVLIYIIVTCGFLYSFSKQGLFRP